VFGRLAVQNDGEAVGGEVNSVGGDLRGLHELVGHKAMYFNLNLGESKS
jgi:hypothetical protein